MPYNNTMTPPMRAPMDTNVMPCATLANANALSAIQLSSGPSALLVPPGDGAPFDPPPPSTPSVEATGRVVGVVEVLLVWVALLFVLFPDDGVMVTTELAVMVDPPEVNTVVATDVVSRTLVLVEPPELVLVLVVPRVVVVED
ncbi:hypothetical protein BDZ89DRAFT_1127762 [Hymenopellis radicata]|nr:hypothetical protein BDZ89DRAFT_1127762 [Hymenopellis radicata]